MSFQNITGHLVLVMAPTGSGKGTLVAHVREKFPAVTYSVSCTTRAIRPYETDGVQYCFLTREQFESKIAQDEFVEWAEFGGNLYGTLRSEIVHRLEKGEVVITEIEVQGVLQLIAAVPPSHRTVVYVEAGGWDVLKTRVQDRAPISDEELALRYARYCEEVSHKHLADVIVYNRDGELGEAKATMEGIMSEVFSKLPA